MNLAEATLAGADFRGATFTRCRGPEAVFEDAGLARAKLLGNNLFEAVFDRADLTAASLAGSNAYGCGFWEGRLESLDVAGAIVAGTVLAGESPS